MASKKLSGKALSLGKSVGYDSNKALEAFEELTSIDYDYPKKLRDFITELFFRYAVEVARDETSFLNEPSIMGQIKDHYSCLSDLLDTMQEAIQSPK